MPPPGEPSLRVVIAPDSFSGTWSAARAAELLEEGARLEADRRRLRVETRRIPMADGGVGTLDVLEASLGGARRHAWVKDPLGEPVRASYLVLPDGTAVLEMAQASGRLCLEVPRDRRHPFLASTFGTGELLLHAAGRGARRIVVGLGGSGTNDGGVGLAQALGVRLLDARGRELMDRRTEGYGAASLLEASAADLSRVHALPGVEILAACDVTSPLCGPRGASTVFGPQKGATAEMVPLLDEALARWAGWVEEHVASTGGAGGSPRDLPGAGAAGGLGFTLAVLLGARVVRGASWVATAVGLDAAMQGAGAVITGEGRLDGQTFLGKVVHEVALRAAGQGVPVGAIGGQVRRDEIQPGLLAHVEDASAGGPTDPATLAAEGDERLRRAAALTLGALVSA